MGEVMEGFYTMAANPFVFEHDVHGRKVTLDRERVSGVVSRGSRVAEIELIFDAFPTVLFSMPWTQVLLPCQRHPTPHPLSISTRIPSNPPFVTPYPSIPESHLALFLLTRFSTPPTTGER